MHKISRRHSENVLFLDNFSAGMSTGASGDRWQDFQTPQWCFPWLRHVVCLRVFNLMCVSVCFRSLLSPALSNTCNTLQHQNKVTRAHAHTHCTPSRAPHTDQTKWVTVTWGPKTSSRPRLVLTKTYVPLCTQTHSGPISYWRVMNSSLCASCGQAATAGQTQHPSREPTNNRAVRVSHL